MDRHEEKTPHLPAPRLRQQGHNARRNRADTQRPPSIRAHRSISDPMLELIEELWPELVHKLPQGDRGPNQDRVLSQICPRPQAPKVKALPLGSDASAWSQR
jgi:hypothetical protein